jgi:hypothetical protein
VLKNGIEPLPSSRRCANAITVNDYESTFTQIINPGTIQKLF